MGLSRRDLSRNRNGRQRAEKNRNRDNSEFHAKGLDMAGHHASLDQRESKNNPVGNIADLLKNQERIELLRELRKMIGEVTDFLSKRSRDIQVSYEKIGPKIAEIYQDFFDREMMQCVTKYERLVRDGLRGDKNMLIRDKRFPDLVFFNKLRSDEIIDELLKKMTVLDIKRSDFDKYRPKNVDEFAMKQFDDFVENFIADWDKNKENRWKKYLQLAESSYANVLMKQEVEGLSGDELADFIRKEMEKTEGSIVKYVAKHIQKINNSVAEVSFLQSAIKGYEAVSKILNPVQDVALERDERRLDSVEKELKSLFGVEDVIDIFKIVGKAVGVKEKPQEFRQRHQEQAVDHGDFVGPAMAVASENFSALVGNVTRHIA